jgi:hypothetical protein
MLYSKGGHNFEMVYRRNARCVASVVLLWPGWLATVASTVIMFKSQAHDKLLGPLSKTGHNERSAVKPEVAAV